MANFHREWRPRMSWALWCKSFGPKCSTDPREADMCCWCRTIRWFLAAFLVGIVIVAGNIRHW